MSTAKTKSIVKSSVIAKKIESMIIAGQLKEGQKLPSERKLCQSLSVSRNCLREAFKELNARGVVETKLGSGTQVALFKQTQANNSLIDLLANDTKTLNDLFHIRKLLESEATYLAALNATEENKRDITTAFNQLKSLSHPQESAIFAEKDIAFHRCIYLAANNQVMLLALNSVRDLMMNCMMQSAKKVYPFALNHKALIKQHEKIYQAVIFGDASAAKKAAKAHLSAVQSYLKLQ